MYSQCPECHARFRVTAEALRAARGTVRCGRCGSAFNAIIWLSDTLPPPFGRERHEPVIEEPLEISGGREPVTGVEFRFTAEDVEQTLADTRGWPGLGDSSLPDDVAEGVLREGLEPPIVIVTESRPFEDITLEGERISIESILTGEPDADVEAEADSTDEFRVLTDVPDSAYPADEGETAAESAFDDAVQDKVSPTERREPVWDDRVGQDVLDGSSAERLEVTAGTDADEGPVLGDLRWPPATPGAEREDLASRRAARRKVLAWSFGCLVLALVLLAQLVDHFRQELVRHPLLGPVVREAYARLGMPLAPNWDLGAFELRQWTTPGEADATGQLRVRASIRNRAAFAQPHPILRLELDDRFGSAVAVRDFDPAEYLKNPSEASRMLGPGASTEADLVVLEPSRDAVGYQLDVCLRESPTILRCARRPD